MEKQRICKICNKRYSNGKALGGHMRSHLAKHPLPSKPQSNSTSTPPPPPPSLTKSQVSTSSHINNHPEIVEMESDSESESQHNHKKRRSKRRRRSVLLSVSQPLFENKAAEDETLSAEDAAIYLIKLSKDDWGRKQEEEGEDDDDDDDEEESLVRIKSSKFKCETCNKVFGSYQALGGHKANHKKIKNNVEDEDDDDEIDEEEWAKESSTKVVHDDHKMMTRTFECPFCFKVFTSGQALGGHKKVHYSNNFPIIATRKSCRNNFFIDLNVPALEVE